MGSLLILLLFASQQTDVGSAEDLCSIGEVTATTVSKPIYSPNFPYGNYPKSLNCSTRITSPENTVIEVFFETFQLSYSTGCVEDFLKITDSVKGTDLQQSCGSRFPWPDYPDKIVSRGNDITITFVTDESFSDIGFRATYKAVHPSPYLFFMAENATIRVAYRQNSYNFNVTPLGVTDPLAVDYDPKTQYVFYSDRGTRTIGKFHLDWRFFQWVLHSENIEEPLGLRIDVNSGLLYWTDAKLGTISVSNLNGQFRHTLIQTELEKPGGIVTEPYEGYIYFTDWGANPKIERADGDGSNRFVLVDSFIISPRALAIDLKERILYWIDSVQKSLEKVNYDGTGRTLLKFISQLNIFSLTLDDNAFFWSARHPTESEDYILMFDRKLETTGHYVKWGRDKHYKGISLRPRQGTDDIEPDTCPAADCNGICLPKPNGQYVCLTDDVTPPIFLNCPNNITAWVGPGKSSSSVSWDEILLENENDVIVSTSHVSGSEFHLGKEIVTIAARDLAGNTAWCNFSVVVKDDVTPPIFLNCPNNITAWVGPGKSSSSVSWDEILLENENDVIVSSSHVSGSEFHLGKEIVTIAARDLAGNEAWCNFFVVVKEDEIPPLIKPCPEDISVSITSPGETSQIVVFAEPELSDNSGEAHWTERPSSWDTAFPIGSTRINYVASDQFGNEAQCSFLVIVSGYAEMTPTMEYHPPTTSHIVNLVIGFGTALMVLGLVAVALIVVAVCKCHRRQGGSNRDLVVENACTNTAYAPHVISATTTRMNPVVIFSGESVQYTKPEFNYGEYVNLRHK